MRNKLQLLLAVFVLSIALFATSVMATPTVDLMFTDGTTEKTLEYNTVDSVFLTVASSYPDGQYEIEFYKDGVYQSNLVELTDYSNWMAIATPFFWTLDLPAGDYEIRASAHDVGGAEMGVTATDSVYFDLQPLTLAMNPSSETIYNNGDTVQLSATGGSSGFYQWSVSSGSNFCTVAQTGIVTSAATAGTCKIKAKDTGSPYYAEATITVTTPPTVTVTPSSATIYATQTQQLYATGGIEGTFTWSVDSGSCSVTTAGLVTGNAAGTCVIRAADTGSTAFGTATITVQAIPTITVNPSSVTLYTTETQSFTASGATGPISWSVSGPCSMTENVLTANNVGTCTVTATDSGSPGVGTATVTVQAVPDLTITPTISYLLVGDTQDFDSTNAVGSEVWSTTTGTICSVDNAGVVTANAIGTCIIVVEDSASPAQASTSFQVVDNPVVTPNPVNMYVTESIDLQIIGVVDTFSVVLTSGTGICSVTGSQTINALAAGSCVVTVTDLITGGFTDVPVTVSDIPTVVVSPNSATLYVTETLQLSATGGVGSYEWSVINGAQYCSIDENGLLLGLANGACTVQVADSASPGADTAAVSIIAIPTITVSPSTATLFVGDVLQFNAAGSPTGVYIWSIIEGVDSCSITATGLLTVLAGGTCTIQADDAGSPGVGTATITVSEVTITPDGAEIYETESIQLEATGGIGGSYDWSVTIGSGYCSVTQSGLVTAIQGGGSCQVVAQDSGSSASDSVIITTLDELYIDIMPQVSVLFAGDELQLSATGGASSDYIWSISSGNEYCSITATGYLSAFGVGDCTVRVEDVASPFFGEMSLTILAIPYVQIVPDSVLLYQTEVQQFTAIGGVSGNYIWTITEGASSCELNQDGLLVALAPGHCVITAEDTSSPGVGTAYVEIREIPTLSVTPESVILLIGNVQQFTATGGSSGLYTWSIVSGSAFCSVDSNGVLLAKKGGSCRVRADDTASPAFGTAVVSIAALEITPEDTNLFVGDELQFEVTGGLSGEYEWSITEGKENCEISYNGLLTVVGEGGCTVRVSDTGSFAFIEADITSRVSSNEPRERLILGSVQNVNSETVTRGGVAKFYISIENTGKEMKNVRATVVIPELGLRRSTNRFDVTKTSSKSFALDIPHDVEPGVYTAHITISNDDIRRTLHRVIRIQ